MASRFSLLVSAATFAWLAISPATAQDMADADTLETALVGNTFQGSMGSADYTSFFGEDGMYYDETGSGSYEITDEGVCYPDTDFGCYQAVIDGDSLSWYQDGEAMGDGTIVEGDPIGFRSQE